MLKQLIIVDLTAGLGQSELSGHFNGIAFSYLIVILSGKCLNTRHSQEMAFMKLNQ